MNEYKDFSTSEYASTLNNCLGIIHRCNIALQINMLSYHKSVIWNLYFFDYGYLINMIVV
jgi:hypothetical protein